MHLAIINASPRVEAKSNTARIIRTFLKGFEKDGNTAEVWHLSDRKQWENAKEAYEKNSNILFAIPLYVENIPGIMLEFIETLQPKKEAGTKMSPFISVPLYSQLKYEGNISKYASPHRS